MTLAKALLSSDRMDWRTPSAVLNLVRQVDEIGFDPCPAPGDLVRPRVRLPKGADGLKAAWGGRGLVFVNPPYGRELPRWVRRCDEAGRMLSAEVILLCPARPDTRWWQEYVARAAAVCFWKGRIKFVGAPHPAPFPSALVYWGEREGRFRRVFDAAGWVVRP